MAVQAIQPTAPSNSLHPHQLQCPAAGLSARQQLKMAARCSRKGLPQFSCRASSEDDYLIDAPVSAGDGFSFTGGKYSDESNPADEWFKQGKMVKAFPVLSSKEKAKDPIFGLTMGASSQTTADVFRWFCIEAGSTNNPSVLLVHGFPSQAYSYRKVLPVLSKKYHAIAFDWIGFGFSDKPQPGYGFDYTLGEYVSAFESLIDGLALGKVSLVVQGYFAPVVIKYAAKHPEKLNHLVLLNPPDPDQFLDDPAEPARLHHRRSEMLVLTFFSLLFCCK